MTRDEARAKVLEMLAGQGQPSEEGIESLVDTFMWLESNGVLTVEGIVLIGENKHINVTKH